VSDGLEPCHERGSNDACDTGDTVARQKAFDATGVGHSAAPLRDADQEPVRRYAVRDLGRPVTEPVLWGEAAGWRL
jgi:hypothetical protein